MQARTEWKPPTGTLGELVRGAEGRVAGLVARRALLEAAARQAPIPPSFQASLESARRRGTVALIAEVKRASPSKGAINASIDAATQAGVFERGGAAAVSILTEPDRFSGSPDDLIHARASSSLPLLKKDFHIHPVQAIEARALGASAMLLIARALSPDNLRVMSDAALAAGVEMVVEVRDEDELERALSVGARMVGVNNRNLETLIIDTGAGERIIPRIPSDRIAIAESGIRDAAGAGDAASLGADAILVGSSLSASADVEGAVRSLANIRWIGRRG